MKRLCLLAAAICAYIVSSACSDATLQSAPGRLNLKIIMNASRVGQFNTITASWNGNITAQPNAPGAGVTTASDSRSINRSAQEQNIDFSKDQLIAAEWDLVARVSDGTANFIDLRCCQTIFAGKAVNTTFTEGQPNCTCDVGCRPCP